MDRLLDADEKKRLRSMRPTVDELLLIDIRRDYEVFRKRWFGNTIPPVSEVSISLAGRCQMDRIIAGGCLGFCIPGHESPSDMPVIALSQDMGTAARRMTMLHEMAHIKVERKFGRDMGHGKHWQAEMKRLARIGAFANHW